MGPEELSGFYEAWGARLQLYARQWVGAAEAEDVVQEVFMRLLREHKQPTNVKAWLFRAVRNGSISQVRKEKGRRRFRERLAEGEPGWFEAEAGDLIDAATAQQLLETLPQEQREVVTLRIWGQMTLKEVAEIVGEPISTVFSRYQAALETMRKKMEISCKKKKD
ncbi:MAG: hypothetical protein AMJ79_16075 [Phycisphaerae bacterium SM23_30]|nr:MAG: hypothetical protein AMJ79_16075 [Phycisphaerae bacterium SM23_30]